MTIYKISDNVKKIIAIAGVLSIAGISLIVAGRTSPPNIPAINLPSTPLFSLKTGDNPAIVLNLSVEFPTVGALYRDNIYNENEEYLGYFNAESCYKYNDNPTETRLNGLSNSDYKRFDSIGPATSRKCNDAFSGNFLNYASASAIDMLRLALSGGDRYIDTPDLTILQRAVLPGGNPRCFFNNGDNFPAKRLTKNGGANYNGAVPNLLKTQANGRDIWIGNMLDRIYFGLSGAGDCTNTEGYRMGTANFSNVSNNIGPVSSRMENLPTDTSRCAGENGSCSFSGTKEVWYGSSNSGNPKWKVAVVRDGTACTNFVFGDPIPGVIKECFTRSTTSTLPPPPTSDPNAPKLTSDNFFYSRVKVCEKNAQGELIDNRNYNFCVQYPSGNYKPTGSIQKYSDRIRLAAFGYALDNGRKYGGVLRAPMKYVGEKTFDIDGIENTPANKNPIREWDIDNGVFYANPDNDTTINPGISGVINYLNKFGRTGQYGFYKVFDPVGELYYESLRYLQGLPPTPAAISNLTPELYDGFPIYTNWTDPFGDGRLSTTDYSCTKANILTIGDINTHDGSIKNTGDRSRNDINIKEWSDVVNAFEKNNTRQYIDGQGRTQTTANPNLVRETTLNRSDNWLSGAAYWAHTHDIRGTDWTVAPGPDLQRRGLRVKSFFFDVNEYGDSSPTISRQYNNRFFLAAKYGGFETDASNLNGNPYNTSGNPFKREDGTNDNNVWQDLNSPGEASTYYLQSDAYSVLNSIENIFKRASAFSSRSISGTAVSNKNVTRIDSAVYQGGFDTSDWSGEVFSIPVTLNNSNAVVLGAEPSWTASSRLSAMASPALNRNIVVGRVGASTTSTLNSSTATAFKWNEIEESLKTNLNKAFLSSTEDDLGADRLNYLRGDQSREGTTFRVRRKILGDIVNSGIVYLGEPQANVESSAGYSAFYNANRMRNPVVFVGANDGMLHAFKADTGDEVFAYIPSWMGPKLSALSRPDYVDNRQSYVDSTPSVGEAKVGSAGTAADWKTVLVSGTGAGGSGVFALDVTNPSDFSASKVMWEFTRADDLDMGHVVGEPGILKVRTSARGAATTTYRWFAVVASGLNNYVSSNGLFSTTGNPALFFLALDKPAGTAWTATGSAPNYYKISLPVDSDLSRDYATGLVSFSSTLGLNNELAQIYMGDLHGKLWKLDFSMLGSQDWTMDKLSFFKKSNRALPFYIAEDDDRPQPISMAPSVVAGPIVAGLATSYIYFGTGKYLETSDKSSTRDNAIYALYDNGTTTADKSNPSSVIRDSGRLMRATLNNATGVVSVSDFTWGRPTGSLGGTNTSGGTTGGGGTNERAGWYIKLPARGERSIGNASVVGNKLVISSVIPQVTFGSGSCATANGTGNEYQVDLDTGDGKFTASTVGLLGEPVVLNVLPATSYSNSNSTGRRTRTTVQQVIQQGTLGVNLSSTVTYSVPAGRLSWRQINNYQDLKNAP